jgi:glycosyltransferase involved in cell wall biosynthesis
MAREERAAVAGVDRVWIPSEREAEQVTAWGTGVPIDVVPNATDTDVYCPGDVPDDDRFDLLFVGTTHYFPNFQGIMWFLDEVWPTIRSRRPGTTLRIVGGMPPTELRDRESEHVRVEGFVDEILPYYRAAALTVVPLLSGSGTRLKLLEAAAVGTAFVSTSIGSEGIDVVGGVHCRIEDDPARFAAACLELLDDDARRAELSSAARRLVLDRYGYAAVGAATARLVDEFLAARVG